MNVRTFWVVTRNSLISELEYRFNYFMWLLSSGVSVAMESAILILTLEGRTELGGFFSEDLWRFVTIAVFLRTTTGQWRVVAEALEEVRDGGFRKYLLQPIHYPSYFVARALGDKLGITLILIVGLAIYKSMVWESPFLSHPFATLFLLSYVVACILAWQIYLMMIYLAFWIDEVHFLQIAFNIGIGIFSGTLLPFSWLSKSIQNFVAWTPFRFLGDWPIRTALGRISLQEYWYLASKSLMWVGILGAALSILGSRGRRRYEAFGG
jgi:ABC-2 type transport system permease protein